MFMHSTAPMAYKRGFNRYHPLYRIDPNSLFLNGLLIWKDLIVSLVPKKGLEPSDLSSAFRFNEIPLFIEYTILSFFSMGSTPSTCSIRWYVFRKNADTTPSKVARNYGLYAYAPEASVGPAASVSPLRRSETPEAEKARGCNCCPRT
jgi:hypothetical protein